MSKMLQRLMLTAAFDSLPLFCWVLVSACDAWVGMGLLDDSFIGAFLGLPLFFWTCNCLIQYIKNAQNATQIETHTHTYICIYLHLKPQLDCFLYNSFCYDQLAHIFHILETAGEISLTCMDWSLAFLASHPS